jgi:outer membrane protein TolC
VEDALVGYLNSQQSLGFEQNSVVAAQRSQQLALVQYREGAVDYQRVLDSQRALLQEQNRMAHAQSSVATNLIALYKALGGGWEVSRGKPFVSEPIRHEMEERTSWGDMLSEPHGTETEENQSPAKR